MNKVNILFELMDGQESCYIDRNNITPSCNDEDENVDEISDIEQNVQIISNQNTIPNYYQFMSLSRNLICHGFNLKIKVRQYMYYNFGSEYSKHVLTRNYYVDQVALSKFIIDNVNNEAYQANITDIDCHQCDVC